MCRTQLCSNVTSVTDTQQPQNSPNHDELSRCQHCGERVTYSRRPADAGYAAFTHDTTNTIACSAAQS